MRFFHVVAALSVICAFAGFAATTPAKTTGAKKVTTHKKSTSKSTAATADTRKTTSGKTVASSIRSKSAKGKTAAKAPASTWRTRQLNPTPERYKEIQRALIAKGYLKGEPSGVWDNDSVAAMSRFQEDQKQTPTGKITAAALIGLGLGAKSAGAPEAAPLGPGPGAAAPAGGVPAAEPIAPSPPPPTAPR